MPDLASDFAHARKALVVAPAGCGKTQLIAEATRVAEGRQLVLTHTHAGVKALKDRMDELRVPHENYRITTLDSFALRFASSYPATSGWTVAEPEKEQWVQLRPAALKSLKLGAIGEVLTASYAGVFVDEYQDCGQVQHQMVNRLAEVLPCRIVGDPLQAVFAGINSGNNEPLSWGVVTSDFNTLAQLEEPHRWRGKNERLGHWLLEIRGALLAGHPIELRGLPFLQHQVITPATSRTEQLKTCYALSKKAGETVIGIRDNRRKCHSLAGQLRNVYSVFEDADGSDLLEAARAIEGQTGVKRVEAFVETAQRWLTLSGHNLDSLVSSLKCNRSPRVKDPAIAAIHPLLVEVRDQAAIGALIPAMKAIEGLPKVMFKSREVWHGLSEGVAKAASTPGLSVRDAIWQRRDLLRRIGRRPPPRCLSTPLLVKGLECAHAVVLDASDFPQAEWIYVALTRASHSLTVLASKTVIHAAKPLM